MKYPMLLLIFAMLTFAYTTHELFISNNQLAAKVAMMKVDQAVLQGELEEAQGLAAKPDKIIGLATAYTCDPSMTAKQKAINCPNGKTATGTRPKAKRTVACDKRDLHKKFYIENIGIVTCEDTGGAIKGKGRFDIYMDSLADARGFGIKPIQYWQID